MFVDGLNSLKYKILKKEMKRTHLHYSVDLYPGESCFLGQTISYQAYDHKAISIKKIPRMKESGRRSITSVRKYCSSKVFVVSLFYLKHIFAGTLRSI